MKADAIERANLQRPMPGMKECVEHIGRIAKTTLPWNLPAEARDFYASEFYAMIVVERERLGNNKREVAQRDVDESHDV